jgi:preprotein translocase subunit SecB
MNIQVQTSNIELEGYYVRNLQFTTAESVESMRLILRKGFHVQTETSVDPEGEYQLKISMNAAGHRNDPNRYRVVLRIATDNQTKESQFPYTFDLTLVGFFRIVGLEIPKPSQDPKVVQTSLAILYASAREILASATGRGPFPALVLPMIRLTLTADVQPARKPTKERTTKKNRQKKIMKPT